MARPKVGLALGAGGARGFAHVGVLKVLRRRGIPVDMIAGSSMGSLIGALYAHSRDPEMLAKLAIHLKRKHWLDLTVTGKLGFVNGEKVKELIRLLTQGKNIEEMSVPLAIVATDLATGERVVFREGPVDCAVRASIAIPGIFTPERLGGRFLVDGGVVDRVPVTAVKEMGADLVIAVDVASCGSPSPIRSVFDVIAQTIDIMTREIMRQRIVEADIVIRPDVGNVGTLSFSNVEAIIAAGERAAEEAADEIVAFL
ncbi:patatin-like phospholipase family protein [Bacillaceae bacterium]